MSSLITRQHTGKPGEDEWISVSDLMSALMMIFLLLSVFYMMFLDEENKLQKIDQQDYLHETAEWKSKLADAEIALAAQAGLLLEAKAENIEKDKLLAEARDQLALIESENALKASKFDAIISEAVIYEDVINELRQELLAEFSPDLQQWNAELRDDLTFRFNEPRTLFSTGDATLKPRFIRILANFFPRYLKVITSDKFKNDITEVRIEGHTSSMWGDLDPYGQEAYFNNMELSQNRSRNTLFYVTLLPESLKHAEWLKSKLTANGLSSSKLVDNNGYLLSDPRSNKIENQMNSQRVDFRVKIDAESKITRIIDSGKTEE